MSKKKRKVTRKQKIKRSQTEKPNSKSNYGRKQDFLKTHGGTGLDYPDKPWKG